MYKHFVNRIVLYFYLSILHSFFNLFPFLHPLHSFINQTCLTRVLESSRT